MKSELAVMSAPELLTFCGIDERLNHWRSLAGLDTAVFDALILQSFYRFAEAVQLAPASESHHHSGSGGLLKHTAEMIYFALKRRREFQLPLGGSITDINNQRSIWTYGIYVACLLHDIGKLSSSIRLMVTYKNGTEKWWSPLGAPLVGNKQVKHYRIAFAKTPYHYHHRLALVHFSFIDPNARSWLAQSTELMSMLCAYLWGDKYESGIIGEIVEFADRESTARNLQIPADHRFSNAIPVIDRYINFIRNWIVDGSIKINVNGGMGWVDAEGNLYLVCRSLADKIIQECSNLGLTQLPQDAVRIYDILQDHGIAIPTEDNKAIWYVLIKTPAYSHKFTCLKLKASKFILPNKPYKALEGQLIAYGAKAPDAVIALETVKHSPETGANDAATAQETENQQATPQTEWETASTVGQPDGSDQTAPSPSSSPSDIDASSSDWDSPDTAENSATLRAPENESNIDWVDEWQDAVATSPLETETSVSQNNDAEFSTVSSAETEKIQAEEAARKLQLRDGPEIMGVAEDDRSPLHSGGEAVDDVKLGEKFFQWVRKGLIEKTILMNDQKAEVHIVKEGVFLVAPAIFKTFLNRHGLSGEQRHANLSRKFQRLKRNIKNGDQNIHKYWVSGSNRATQISGWLLPFDSIYGTEYPVPKPNKYIHKTLGGETDD